MKIKKITVALLAGSMVLSMLAGCGTATEESTVSQGSSEETANVSESVDSTSSSENFVSNDGSIVDIEMYGLGFFGEDGLNEVMDAINAISEKKIGVHVNYHILDIQSYTSQLPMMLISDSEKADLIMDTAITVCGFPILQSQNQLMDITDYVDEYAPETKELMKDYLPATTVNGSIYGIPCYRVYNSSYYIVMRKDVLDALNLTEEAQNISSWSDYKNLLLKVQAAQDSLPENLRTNVMVSNEDAEGNVMAGWMIDLGTDDFSGNYGFETLGDSTRIVKVNDDGKVENYYADDDYRAMCERVADFYNSGLVYKDAATAQDSGDQEMANEVTFSYVVQSEIGVEQAKKSATGYDVVCVPFVDVPIQTTNGNTWAWSVPQNLEEPEAAVAFMNLMYTDPDIENLFVYGIEGRDYELNDEGEACLLDSKVYQNSDFFFGNQFNAYPAEGTGGDFREKSLENMRSAKISPYYGCVIDTTPVANEMTALTAVKKKYEAGLASGSADISTLDTMNSELEGAGLQKYLDYYQEQLDNWKAEQK